MKRIYIEMIIASLILAWIVGNMILTGTVFVSCYPIIIGFCLQFIGTSVAITTPED